MTKRAATVGRGTAWVAAALAALLGGCAGGGEAPSLALPAMPSLPDLSSVASITSAENDPPQGSATELYTRIARGSVGCWFAASGPLKKDYIYHAEADAPSRGGKAEIFIHVRDPSQPNPRGAKAYRISIDPQDETSAKLATENLKMPEPMAAAMTADVNRWSRGEQGCKGATTAAGWSPEDPTAAVPPGVKKPADKKTATGKAASKPGATPVAGPMGKTAAKPAPAPKTAAP